MDPLCLPFSTSSPDLHAGLHGLADLRPPPDHTFSEAAVPLMTTSSSGDPGAPGDKVNSTMSPRKRRKVSTKRPSKRFSAHQKLILEKFFNTKAYPEEDELSELAERTQLDRKQVNTWFTNKRARNDPKGECTSPFKLEDTDHAKITTLGRLRSNLM
jgi:hypothetical protein